MKYLLNEFLCKSLMECGDLNKITKSKRIPNNLILIKISFIHKCIRLIALFLSTQSSHEPDSKNHDLQRVNSFQQDPERMTLVAYLINPLTL